MNKIVSTILVGVLGAVSFFGGIFYSTEKFKDEVKVWNTRFYGIVEKVEVFERVSDPKTIRLYVNELVKILDDIEFLHKLIETGQLADDALDNYLEEKQVEIISMSANIDSVTSQVSSMLDSSHTHIHGMVDELKLDIQTSLSDVTMDNLSRVEELQKQLKTANDKIDELNKVIDKIKNSKLSKYLK